MSNAEMVNPNLPPKRRMGCLGMALIGSGVLGLLLCMGCGGMMYFTYLQVNSAMKEQISRNELVKQHLGEVQEVTLDWKELQSGKLKLEVQGSNGTGTIIADAQEMDKQDDGPKTGKLILPSGEEIDIQIE